MNPFPSIVQGAPGAQNGKKPIAMVTGGSRGIGRSICVKLAQAGYVIVYCYNVERPDAFDTLREIEQAGGEALALRCDVSSMLECEALFKQVVQRFGSVDVLVNCAGITRDSNLASMTEASWNIVIDTNLNGVFNLSRAAIFHFMKKKAGIIINVSSVAGIYGSATQTNYSASKAGVIGFSKALAKEVAPYGIRVNVVAPGFIETDMTAILNEKATKTALDKIPLRRFGKPDDIGAMVRFLVSEEAGYVTGQVIQVDGGIVL